MLWADRAREEGKERALKDLGFMLSWPGKPLEGSKVETVICGLVHTRKKKSPECSFG